MIDNILIWNFILGKNKNKSASRTFQNCVGGKCEGELQIITLCMSMKVADILDSQNKYSREVSSLPRSVFHLPASDVFYLSPRHVMLLHFNPNPLSSADILSTAATTNPCTEKVSTTIPSRLWKYCVSCNIFPAHPHPSTSTQSASNDTGFFCSEYCSFFPQAILA